MKKRILFVDDEPMILDALRRTLRPLNAEWDMAFADSGQKALELMDQLPFDVVISDISRKFCLAPCSSRVGRAA